MKKKIIASALAGVILCTLLVGCSNSKAPSTNSAGTPQSTAATQSPAGNGVMFTDSAGREVEIPEKITRIAPSGMLAQMMLYAIAPDMLVTIASDFTEEAKPFIPEEYQNLPVVGQFYGDENLSLEEVAAIGPEIVIDLGEAKDTVIEDMDNITGAIGVPTIHIDATLDSTGDAYRTLGKLLGREEQGEKLAKFCEETYAETQALMAEVGQDKADLLYCLGDSGLNVIATGSYHAEIVNMISNNVAEVDNPTSMGTGNEVNMEQIMMWNPEVIFFAPNSIYDTVGEEATWQQLDAIKNGSYYEVPIGPYNWMGDPPSINRYLGMMWATTLLYPDLATIDLYEKVAEYYQLFYNHDLSVEEYDVLVANSIKK